jgi:hypothetical protein
MHQSPTAARTRGYASGAAMPVSTSALTVESRRISGPIGATAQYEQTGTPGTATGWVQLVAWSTRVSDYDPRCIACHVSYDLARVHGKLRFALPSTNNTSNRRRGAA